MNNEMKSESATGKSSDEPVDYETLVDLFQRALLHTLRKHSVSDSFLDFWVPDADPALGIASMVDSARIGGRARISIRFRLATLPVERLPELQRALADVGRLAWSVEGTSVLLHATDLKHAGAGGAARRGSRQAPAYWKPVETPNAPKGAPQASKRWDSSELPEFGDVHPHFRSALKAALNRLSQEGDSGKTIPELVQVTGQEGSTVLTLAVDPGTHIVRSARHTGATAPSARAILDLFCRAAHGLPIQEVADHVGLKVLESLIDLDANTPVGGVLLPGNAGAPFTLPPRLARQAYDAYRARTGLEPGTNFYIAPPSAQWQSFSSEQRVQKVKDCLGTFIQSEYLQPNDMTILGIQKSKSGYDVRVVVGFAERVPIDAKPDLMRRLERLLRHELEPEIDLVADRAKDTSPLRRLS